MASCLCTNYLANIIIFAYFDDWVFIKSDDVYKDITEILVKKKGDAHLETCTW